MAPLFSSLRSRIFGLFILLLIAVQTVSFVTSYYSNKQRAEHQLASVLSNAEHLLKEKLQSRSYYLSAFTEISATDRVLVEQFSSAHRNLSLPLNNHRKRIDADIALAIDVDAVIIGHLQVKDSNKEIKRVENGNKINEPFVQTDWLKDHPVEVYYANNKQIYQMVITPVLEKFEIVGHIALGYEINKALANELAGLSSFYVGFALQEQENWQWIAQNDAMRQDKFIIEGDSPLQAMHEGSLIGKHLRLGEINNVAVNATFFQSRSNLIAAIKQDSFNIFLLIALTLAASLFGAYFIANGVSRPVRSFVDLAKQIAQGNYNSTARIGSTDELNQLAAQFSVMQQAIEERENEITRQAFSDLLSGLPNRSQFYREMHDIKEPYLLCQINVRRISEINDTLGHDVGDEVILEIAYRLGKLEKPLFHVSGNGFLIRFDHQTEKDIKTTVSHINRVIEPSFIYQNISIHLQVNIGITISDGWSQANQVLKEADSAMQIAKRKNLKYQIYDRQIDLNTLDRLQLVNRLRGAIENDEFLLFFQPKLNLATNNIEEVEALLRWNHPVNGLITPDSFIHIADQTGQMTALSKWVLNEAIEQYIYWRSKGLALNIAINISPENLLDDEFCQYLIDTLANDGSLTDALSFEITEDAFVDHSSKAVDNIIMLRTHGINLSIDDYGTGYSSLAQLKNLPVQELKIDRAFIEHLIHQPQDQLIVESTIQLSHQLGLKVVAEGVEDKLTLDWLRDKKCETVQGYYISRPLSSEDLEQWLEKGEYKVKLWDQPADLSLENK
ncbi:GGDEF domain-containing phosphodiesterase [Thalassotalea sp. Y01]|uniref:GGDEF domain-containing phosphodiesterase n=1 Tax=Thalassotalea sp. Y01 TaxID=2729613 RepID=UPI00145D973C|nr:GGDEF domain-containing phosphodiesterase [Thalassotalea sp. Y01]NMP14839.1 EAL domain-containing protein [Thalassotalea sp. Y01]